LRNGSLVAIKVLLLASSTLGVQEYLKEIKVIFSIEHENLIKLHECCMEDDHKILVYGYLKSKSLEQTLNGN